MRRRYLALYLLFGLCKVRENGDGELMLVDFHPGILQPLQLGSARFVARGGAASLNTAGDERTLLVHACLSARHAGSSP